jgi:hypothetical protein
MQVINKFPEQNDNGKSFIEAAPGSVEIGALVVYEHAEYIENVKPNRLRKVSGPQVIAAWTQIFGNIRGAGAVFDRDGVTLQRFYL